MYAKKVTLHIYINRKICRYSHSVAGEYTRIRHEETFFREVSVVTLPTAHGDGRGWRSNGDASADVVPKAAPPAPAAAS